MPVYGCDIVAPFFNCRLRRWLFVALARVGRTVLAASFVKSCNILLLRNIFL